MKTRLAPIAGRPARARRRASSAVPGRDENPLAWRPGSVLGRAVRVSVFGIVSALLALGAHRLAGGAVPPTWSVFTAMSAFLVLGWLASRRERTGIHLGVLVAGTQVAAHAWFVLPAVLAMSRTRNSTMSDSGLVAAILCHHGSATVTPAELAAATRGLDLNALRGAAAVSATTTAEHAGAGGLIAAFALMLAAHLAAALVVAWWLRIGERRAWSALRRLARSCTVHYGIPSLRAVMLAFTPRPFVLTPQRWSGLLSGRGPPALRLALSR